MLSDLLLPADDEWSLPRQTLHETLRAIVQLVFMSALLGVVLWTGNDLSWRHLAGMTTWYLAFAAIRPLPQLWSLMRWPRWTSVPAAGGFAAASLLAGSRLSGLSLSGPRLLAAAVATVLAAGFAWYAVQKHARQISASPDHGSWGDARDMSV